MRHAISGNQRETFAAVHVSLQMMKFASFGAIGLALCAVVGCSSSDAGGGQENLGNTSSFEGIYQLTGASENTTSCATAGDSKLTKLNDKFFVITSSQVFGEKYVILISCSDVANCQTKRTAQQANQFYQIEYSFTLTSSTNATTLNGFEATTGTNEGTQCVGRTYADHVLTLAADHSVHLESRSKKLADQPEDSDGFCVVEPAKSKEEAASVACSSLEAFDGSFVQN